MPTTVINMFPGPGVGKSTTAAGLFFFMKCAGFRCELVTEFPKELEYEGRHEEMKNQLLILGEQERRQRRLLDKVDYVVTDSPLILGPTYSVDPVDKAAVAQAANMMFAKYDNVNIWLNRVKPYQQYGRRQTEEQAREKDVQIRAYLTSFGCPIHFEVDGDRNAPLKILDFLEQRKSVP